MKPPSPTDAFTGRAALTVQETAEAIGVVPNTIWTAIAEGELAAFKLGRRTLVQVSSIRRLMDARAIAPHPRKRLRSGGGIGGIRARAAAEDAA
jgi:excisionase family DNA binding protein